MRKGVRCVCYDRLADRSGLNEYYRTENILEVSFFPVQNLIIKLGNITCVSL